jgi:predicted kinase
MLIIFGGLPGTGKTVIAQQLARELGAVYLRIDSMEQAIRDCGVVSESLDDAGYRVGYAVAEDNLRLGKTVIADSVNPLRLTREGWISVADQARAKAIEVEITCSEPAQHRNRVETRSADIKGLRLPTWQEVVSREYEPWERDHVVIDTASRSVAALSSFACVTSGCWHLSLLAFCTALRETPASAAVRHTPPSRLLITLWLTAVIPTRRPCLTSSTIMRSPVNVLPEPGGPWIGSTEASRGSDCTRAFAGSLVIRRSAISRTGYCSFA